jgi:hypothetical protein
LISVRDYGAPGTGSEIHPYGVRQAAEGSYMLFQVWDWNGPQYDLSFYVLFEQPGKSVQVRVFRTSYYAVPVQRLFQLMQVADFEQVRHIDGAFYQPVLVGTKVPAA